MWSTASALHETGTTYLHSPPIFNGTCGSALFLFLSGSSLTTIIIHEPENVELLLVHFIQCYKCNWQTTFLVSLLDFWSSDTRLVHVTQESRQIYQLNVHLFHFTYLCMCALKTVLLWFNSIIINECRFESSLELMLYCFYVPTINTILNSNKYFYANSFKTMYMYAILTISMLFIP